MRLPLALLLLTSLLSCAHQSEFTPPPQTAFTERETKYVSRDGTRIAATLFLPETEGRVAAAVFIHGSGTSDRRNSVGDAIARGLASRRVAVLYPDKRGSGKSEGDWTEVGFDALAADAAAGAALLRGEGRVDPRRVGVIGFSQGGHIAPLAAQVADAAFAIGISGSLVTMREQIIDEVQLMGERAGLTAAEIEILDEIHRLAFVYGLTGNGWEEYAAARESAASRDWPGAEIAAGFPASRDHVAWRWTPLIFDYDPVPEWKALRIPALIIYGDSDELVRVSESVGLARRELPGVEVWVVDAGHGGLVRAEGVLERVALWVKRVKR